MATMLTHHQVWGAVDRLAARCGYSPSGLAKKAGLDPTSFNRSKRSTSGGRPRWPSTESVAKILQATGVSIDEFILLLNKKERRPMRPVPLLSFADAGASEYFDGHGLPIGSDWDEFSFPSISEDHVYALKISDHSMEPLFRKDAIILVSPTTPIRKGDRVVVKTKDGEVFVKQLKCKNAKVVELASFNSPHKGRSLPTSDILWIVRIIWASQ